MWFHASLVEGQCDQCHFSLFCLGFCGAFSQWCLVLEELFVLLVRGSKVKNNLYHCFSDVIP